MDLPAGTQFKQALLQESPLQIVGAINPYCALLAEQAGFKSIYLSGAGVANAQYGMPDLGMITLTEVVQEARKITNISKLPLLVDVDTGFGDILNVERTIRELERAGAAAVHLEDQIMSKRCGHRDNKKVISCADMVEKIKIATSAKKHPDFTIMARSDAVAIEGLSKAIDRMQKYVEAGANMIFAEALYDLEDYKTVTDNINVPVLANITEFGKTPLFTVEELASVNIQLVLYPLSAFRAMSKAATEVYTAIRKQKTQKDCLSDMQTREELYKTLDYYSYEQKLEDFLSNN
ncbi:MAG: methylisocitrate lyase [Gammaproteobacteria bacterium]|nr:methylisocitrate lyase [Gammaproteobacteria bacterium]